MSGDQHISDLELVARFKATGDSSLFAELFDRHYKRIYQIARKSLASREAAEDAAIETFARAYKQIASFDERKAESNLQAWLATICRNACLDELRKMQIRGQHQSLDDTWDDCIEDVPASSPLSGYSDQEIAVLFDEMDREIESIPLARRQCWLLHRVEGFKYKEIAEMTGLSFEEVRTHIQAVDRCLERKFR
jgi:RNA polymerase sigma-70 factor (ECF subfamily)